MLGTSTNEECGMATQPSKPLWVVCNNGGGPTMLLHSAQGLYKNN